MPFYITGFRPCSTAIRTNSDNTDKEWQSGIHSVQYASSCARLLCRVSGSAAVSARHAERL